jgi:putative ABC transport system ATP-binding protein
MLEIKNVTKIYGEGTARITALDTISFTVEQGDFIAIMGPSGSGKSTLLNVIGGLDRISCGEIYLDNERIDTMDENTLVDIRRGKIAYIFQQYHLIPSLSALENVLLPLIFYRDNRDEKEALKLLQRVGLEKRINHKSAQLSGGEQQRVAIARALVAHPLFILADEPTGNMDQKTGREILEIFKLLNTEGQSIIMVTHDPDIAGYARKIIVLQDGRISDVIDQVKRHCVIPSKG